MPQLLYRITGIDSNTELELSKNSQLMTLEEQKYI